MPERFIACLNCGHRFDHHEDIGCVFHLMPKIGITKNGGPRERCACAGFVDSGRAL